MCNYIHLHVWTTSQNGYSTMSLFWPQKITFEQLPTVNVSLFNVMPLSFTQYFSVFSWMVTKNCSSILWHEQFSPMRSKTTIGSDASTNGLKTVSTRILIIFFFNISNLLMDDWTQVFSSWFYYCNFHWRWNTNKKKF